MKLSAQITDTVKFGLMMIIFPFVVLISYSLEKKIISNISDGKGNQRIGHPPMNLHNPCDDVHYLV
jgi:hypothetical protein